MNLLSEYFQPSDDNIRANFIVLLLKERSVDSRIRVSGFLSLIIFFIKPKLCLSLIFIFTVGTQIFSF